MSRPMVSIVMPVWNAARFVGRSLESVAAQTFGDFEMVCVDDGSPDDSLEVIRAFERRDPRFRAIAAPHAGACAALNRCLAEARGEYICFLDNDDLLHSEALARAVEAIKSTNSDVLFFDWLPTVIADEENPAMPNLSGARAKIIPDILDWSLVDRRGFVNRVLLGSKIYRREVLEGFRFDEDFTYGDLLLYWSVFARPGLVAAILPEPLYIYRERPGSIIHSKLSPKKAADRADAIRRIAGIVSRVNPACLAKVRRGLFPEIAWTAVKWSMKDAECLSAVCAVLSEDVRERRLRWLDFPLRRISRVLRIRKAIRAYEKGKGDSK